MTAQLDMFGPGAIKTESMRREDVRVRRAASKRPSIDQRWAGFHQTNPHVLDEMLRLARARVAAGATRVGIKALWEELRSWLTVTGGSDYKLDNSYTAIYARKLIERDPSLAVVIELRTRKAKK